MRLEQKASRCARARSQNAFKLRSSVMGFSFQKVSLEAVGGWGARLNEGKSVVKEDI